MAHESDASGGPKRAQGRAARSPRGGAVHTPAKGRRLRQAGTGAAGHLIGSRRRGWLNDRRRAYLNDRRQAWMNSRGAWPVRRRLALFFSLAFLISWLIWPLTLLNPQSSPMAPFGPAVAAVLVTVLSEGKEGVVRLLRQLGRWRVPARWYLVAFGLPCLMVVASAVLTVAGGAPAPDLGPNPGWFMLVGTFAATLVVVGLFEELGWRGYALPLLQHNRTALAAALLLGAVWALWHIPELASDPTQQRPPVPFLLMVVAQSVLLAWIYNSTAALGGTGTSNSAAAPSRTGTPSRIGARDRSRASNSTRALEAKRRAGGRNTSGSVPLCMVFHAMFNTAGALILPAFAGPHYLTLWWTLALLHVLAALVVIAYSGPWRLARTLDTEPLHGIT